MVSTNETLPALKEYAFQPYTLRKHTADNQDHQVPKGRSGHRIVSDNSYIYSFGGYNPFLNLGENGLDVVTENVKLFKEFWRFNIACREWKKLTQFSMSLPKHLASNAVILKENILIVHGGTGLPFGFVNSNMTYVADLKHNESLKLLETKGTHPKPRYGQAMIVHGHHLYVFGGTEGCEFSSDIHRLDLKTKVWEEIYISKGISTAEPEGRYRHEIALYNSKIIVFGGGTDRDVFDFEHLPAFNIITREWEVLTTIGDPNCDRGSQPRFPAPRRCHGGVQVMEDGDEDSEFVICGGYNGDEIFSDMWKINLRTLQWTRCKEDLMHPLYFHSTSLSPCGQMFIFGGICEISKYDTSFTFRTNDLFSTWVKIPKLTEICWDAILHYNLNICQNSKLKLLDSGVPKEFVERIQC